MSQTIDSRVVQMQFDNQQFESGAAQSMGTLKNLDKALKAMDGAQAFANVSRAAGSVDFSGISSGVQALQERFSVMGTFVHDTLLEMVNSAVNAGKQISNALVFTPAKTGFAEYELQLNSTQRILANTKSKGEDIKSVNAALDELNEYADLTIYNFAQMTDNIGRFTSAGVGLKESVTAIKGLSNAAALLGADSNAAARAGYQLSQALASGTIRLMDWNSLVNASMGGEKMQEAITRVARHHGVAIDAMIEKEGSFRDTLQAGWLTSDIMLEALSHFTMANDEASRSALEAAGYTQEEIDAIIELGESATESATVVKTASQLFDTLGEELGSVWAQTWRSVMGDYEEAKTTFSAIHDELSDLISVWADWQSALVEGWADLGGRADLFDSFFNAFDALKSVLGPIGQAFKDVFPPITSERLVDMTRKLKEFTKSLVLNDDQMSKLRETATTVFTAIKNVLTPISDVASFAFKTLSSAFKLITNVIGKAIVAISKGINGLQDFSNPISGFVSKFEKIPQTLDDLRIKMDAGFLDFLPEFGDSLSDTLKNVGDGLADAGQTFGEAVKNVFANSESFLEGLKTAMTGMTNVFGLFGEIISTLLSGICESITNFWVKLTGIDFSAVPNSIRKAFDWLINGGAENIFKILTSFTYYDLAQFLSKQGKGLTTAFDLIKNPIKTFVDWFERISLKSIPKKFGNMLQGMANEQNTRAIRNLAVAIALLAGSLLLLSSIPWDKMKVGLIGFSAVVGSLVGVIVLLAKVGGSLTATTKSFRASFTKGLSFNKAVSTKLYSLAAALIAFGSAVLILANALKMLSEIGSWKKLGVGVSGLVVVIGSLTGAMALLSKFGRNVSAKMAAPILAISLCVKSLSRVVREIADLNLEKAAQGVGGLVIILGALSGAFALIGTLGEVSLRSSVAMIAIAAAVKVMGDVAASISKLKLESAAHGVGALVIMMGALAGLLSATSKTDRPAISASVAILAVSKFMSQLGETLNVMTQIATKNPIQAAVSLLSIMAVIGEVMLLMKKMPQKGGFGAAASLLSMSIAISALAVSLKVLSTANPLTLAANLILLGTAIAALTVSSKFLGSAIPALAKLGLIFIEIGAGAALFAGAMAVVNVALITLSSTIAIAASSIIANAPLIGKALLAIIQMALNVVIRSADQIAEAIFAVILAILGRVREAIPRITEELAMIFVDGMNAITEYAPQIADAFFNMFMAVFDSLIPRTPEFMGKLREFLDGIFKELKNMVKDVSIDDVEEVGALIVAVIGVLAIVGKLHGVALAALKGLGVVTLVIAGIGAVLVGFGELAKIPGINELVANGGELLSNIGYAIGDFVGSIIGGFGAGTTSGLPEIGTNLSNFATNVEPFVSYMKTNGSTLLTAIGQLLDASIQINQIKDVKPKKLVKFSDSLNEFAVPFREFCNSMDGINTSAVSTAALAAKRLAEMVKTLSEAGGGLEGLITGNGMSLEDFGKQLEPFGESLKTASESFEGVKADAILAAVPAADALADLAGSMYRTGGAWQKFVGEHLSLDDFGSQVDSFATALKGASESFDGVKVGAIEAALPAAEALADLAGEMVRFGGTWQRFTGEKTTLSGFGAQVSAFGTGLAEASGSFELVKVDAIQKAIPAAQALAELAEAMQSNGGVESWFSGNKETLSSFGEDLTGFASSFVSFGNTMSTLPSGISEKVVTIVESLSALASIKEKVTDLGTLKNGINRIAGMKDNFVSFGDAIVAFSDAVTGIDATAVQNATVATECITAIANGLPSQDDIDAIPDLSGLQTKFENMATSIKTFGESLGDIDPSQISGATQAFDEIITLINRINSINVSSFSGLAEAFKNAASNAVTSFKSTITGANVSAIVNAFFGSARSAALASGSSLTANFVKPVRDANQSVKNMAPQISATGRSLIEALGQGVSGNKTVVMTAFMTAVSSAKTAVSNKSSEFYTAGANLVQGLINGINYKKSAAIQAAYELGSAVAQATRNATGERSPSKVFYQIGDYLVQGLAIGVNQNADKAISASRQLAKGTIKAMQEELRINSPSKVARDEVGNWIVEGIAEGIEKNMSAEEAAAKKAENIMNAFQAALDTIDLKFQSREIDRKITQILDLTGSNTRSLTEASYKDERDKASQIYEHKKGAYDTIVKEIGEDSDEAIKAYNEMQQAYYDMLNAQKEYETYMLSSADKYTAADKIQENAEKELEIWKNANPWASDREVAEKEQELKNKTIELSKKKAEDAASYYYAALKVFGENDTRTIDAYSQYLEAMKAYSENFKKDVDKTADYYKSEAQLAREWYKFWVEFEKQHQAEIEAGIFTKEQVAAAWGETEHYNPLTGQRVSEVNDILKQIDDAGRMAMDEVADRLINGGQVIASGVSGFTEGAVDACTSIAETMHTSLSEIGAASVDSMCLSMTSEIPEVVRAGNQVVSSIPEQVIPANQSDWTKAGLDLVNSMVKGVKSGESALAAAISTVVQNAMQKAMSAYSKMFGTSGLGNAPGSSQPKIGYSSGSGGTFSRKDVKELSENAQKNLDDATKKWLDKNPEYTSTIDMFWSFDAAQREGRLKDWMRDDQGNIVKIGESIGEGLATGMRQATYGVKQAAKTMTGVIPQTVKTGLAIHSPSRVMMEFGRYVDIGLARGITDNTEMVGIATEMMLNTIATEVDEGVETPEIIPVIDLDALQEEVNMANKMLGQVSIDQASLVAGAIQNGKPGSVAQYELSRPVVNNNFTQNNYSPKALSNAEIYRQSRNMFAMATRKRG